MSTENLNNQEAVAKLQSLVDKIDIGMLSTFSKDDEYPHTIPMSRQEVDDEGNIWFMLSADSNTAKHLAEDHRVSIAFAHVGDYNFLSINGRGTLSRDQERIDKYWNQFVAAWFEKGKEDPDIRILKVTPCDAHYWDNKSNKLVTFLSIAYTAVTGNQTDMGREGSLNV